MEMRLWSIGGMILRRENSEKNCSSAQTGFFLEVPRVSAVIIIASMLLVRTSFISR